MVIVHVLDTSAVIALLRGEPGDDVVEAILTAPGDTCHIHAVNLCEVYYEFLRVSGPSIADQIVDDIVAQGVILQNDLDAAFWKSVGNLKVDPGRLSLADCFGFALAVRLGADFVTADHHEFDRIAPLGIAPVTFIR